MRYLLVLGFACDVYRREPRARIFVGDKLIDEFNIPNTPDNLTKAEHIFYKDNHVLQSYSQIEQYNLRTKNIPPLKFYEVEIDKKIKHLTLCINIDNNDSNYTNGFMTTSTLIKLKICYFFPLDVTLLSRLHKITSKNIRTQNYAWYYMRKNIIFDLKLNGVYWKDLDGKKNEITSQNYLAKYNIGSSGNFFCNLVKKYGILIPKVSTYSRCFFHIIMIGYVLNKYKQYENQ